MVMAKPMQFCNGLRISVFAYQTQLKWSSITKVQQCGKIGYYEAIWMYQRQRCAVLTDLNLIGRKDPIFHWACRESRTFVADEMQNLAFLRKKIKFMWVLLHTKFRKHHL
ncbi:hypothetical protein DHW03_08375 [Pedobacter yonginense]|uniref:Uncharacterized protein n=1 Tax=Pedobacter yonginense TaxID=651869 RepID=A0A317ELW4_9SPHI|nr:hypothetical protein DHW03_08375 [Pedobacter yonginense]